MRQRQALLDQDKEEEEYEIVTLHEIDGIVDLHSDNFTTTTPTTAEETAGADDQHDHYDLLQQQDDQGSFNITDDIYGAVGDGVTVNTIAIQAAIEDAHQYYIDNNSNDNENDNSNNIIMGRIIIPSGNFCTGNLILQSGVELLFHDGATLTASLRRLEDYQFGPRWLALIRAHKAHHISLRGNGTTNNPHHCATIDGRGRALALVTDQLCRDGAIEDPDYNHARRRPSERQRPQNIEFVACRHVTIANLHMNHAAGWNQCYQQCEHVNIQNVVVRSDSYWNNDGMDIVDCKYVQIRDCDIDCADDGICLKSQSPRERRPTDVNGNDDDSDDQLGVYNVKIEHCRIRSSASAIKLGTSSKVAFQHVFIRHVIVHDTARSVLALESVDGAMIENVCASHIVARNTGNPLLIRLGQRADGAVGSIRNVTISHMVADVPFAAPDGAHDIRAPPPSELSNPLPCVIAGHPDHARDGIQNIVLQHWDVTFPGRANCGLAYVPLSRLSDVPERVDAYPEYTMFGELPAYALYVRHAGGVRLEDVRLHLAHGATDFRPGLVFDDVENVAVGPKVRLPVEGWNEGPQFVFQNARNVQLANDVDQRLVEFIGEDQDKRGP